MRNKEVAEILYKMGMLLEIQGENIFKIKAYYKASDNIAALAEDIEAIKNEGRLSTIEGVGETLETKITEFLDTGKITAYQKLTAEIPESLLDIVEIPSVGPKKTKMFFDKLGVKDVASLKEAVLKNKLKGLEGIKEKTIQNIKRGIELIEQKSSRMNLGEATALADEIKKALLALGQVRKLEAAGSLRRGCETVRDIDILADSSDPAKTMEKFVTLPLVKEILAHGETKSSIRTLNNVQVDLRIVEPKQFGSALLYFTGSKNFNIKLRQIAIDQQKKVSEYGVFKVTGGGEKCLASKTESDCFKALGLGYIPPELRETIGEAEIFSGREIPELIERGDVKGDLHVHSTWSDGVDSIEKLAAAARDAGYEYLAVCDHSPKLAVANGMKAEDIVKKRKEIDTLNKKFKNFYLMLGTEVEIDTKGNLDYNDKLLSEFEVVVAAVHTAFEQPSSDMTGRIITACRNKQVNILAHPTAVHFGKRQPLEIDFKEVVKAAVDNNVFLEINAFPVRLDLNSENIYFARRLGAKFAVNSDAHRAVQLDFIKFGIGLARRGWLNKKDVLNTFSLEKLQAAIRKN